jgi:hypothetical protein
MLNYLYFFNKEQNYCEVSDKESYEESDKETDEEEDSVCELDAKGREVVRGENGEFGYSTTFDKNLDLFSLVNRDIEHSELVRKFVESWNENANICIKTLLNFRDIRNGKGEKMITYKMMLMIKSTTLEIYNKILPVFVELGCWKDVVKLIEYTERYMKEVGSDREYDMIIKQLEKDTNEEYPSLCAKWVPGENSKYGRIAKELARRMGMAMSKYRKYVGTIRKKLNLVETNLSQQTTDKIEFGRVPGKAMQIYSSAFRRSHNVKKIESESRLKLSERYIEYLINLEKGIEKVNYKGLMPHEILEKITGENSEIYEKQWNSIRDEIKKSGVFERALSIVDVSGSMSGRPMSVAVALGILVSECSSGPFENKVLTFSHKPTFIQLNGSLYEKKKKIMDDEGQGFNTDIQKVFELLISIYDVYGKELIDTLYIYTDMQFDMTDRNLKGMSVSEKFSGMFEEKKYKMPKIVCWNLRSAKSTPFTKEDENVCMLSGFSHNVLDAFLKNDYEKLSLGSIFLDTIGEYPDFDTDVKMENKRLFLSFADVN